MKLRVGVIFGGRSGEHEIAVRSAKTVIEQIDKSKYDVVPIAIDSSGKWLNPLRSLQLLTAPTREIFENEFDKFDNSAVSLAGDPGFRGLSASNAELNTPIDVIFPVLHGTYGEDGTVQGLPEMADMPYVGCGVLASACGMDKAVMKTLFKDAGLPMCKYIWFLRRDWDANPATVIAEVAKAIAYPCFVKPANLGSSVGVSRATDDESLRAAIDLAAQYD